MSVTLPNPATYRTSETIHCHEVMVRKSVISLGDAFAFIVPLLQVVEFHLAGLLLAADLMMFAALPIALIRHPDRLRQKPVPTVLTLGVFWLAAQIVTDLVRNSAPEDYTRGWLKICFVLVNLTVVWLRDLWQPPPICAVRSWTCRRNDSIVPRSSSRRCCFVALEVRLRYSNHNVGCDVCSTI